MGFASLIACDVERAPFGSPRKIPTDHHGASEAHYPAAAQFAAGALAFVLRLVLLSAFASLGTRGFGTAFSALLAMSAIFCAVAGAMRREEMFGRALTHWDEAAAYAVLGHLAAVLA